LVKPVSPEVKLAQGNVILAMLAAVLLLVALIVTFL
jgi:hypothetical protein